MQSPRPCSESYRWIDAIKRVSGNGIAAPDAGPLLKPYWREAKRLKMSPQERFQYAVERAKQDAEEIRKCQRSSKPTQLSPKPSQLSPRASRLSPRRKPLPPVPPRSPTLSPTLSPKPTLSPNPTASGTLSPKPTRFSDRFSDFSSRSSTKLFQQSPLISIRRVSSKTQ